MKEIEQAFPSYKNHAGRPGIQVFFCLSYHILFCNKTLERKMYIYKIFYENTNK